MGYRNYIAPITKVEYERIKNFTKEDLYREHNEDLEDGYVGVYNILMKLFMSLESTLSNSIRSYLNLYF